MKDKVSIARVALLHPRIRKNAEEFITESEDQLGVTLRIVQGLRTIEEQDALYAKGRSKPGNKVTNAKGGQSYHNYGLAIDLVEIKDGKAKWDFDYELLLPFANKYGFKWGGLFKTIVDKPHFEKKYGYTWRRLLEKYNNGDFIKNTKYVNL